MEMGIPWKFHENGTKVASSGNG